MEYYFKGDLCQMASQASLLRNYGFCIIMSNVYPTVKTEEEYIKAINLIYTMKCEGWWHYKDRLIENGICTKYEYWKNLGSSRDVKLYHFENRKDIWNGDVLLNGVITKDENTLIFRGDKINIGEKEYVIE